MPDARVEPDGMFRVGVSQTEPYLSVWSSVSLFPRLELSGRYVKIDGVPGFPEAPELGDYRDKVFDAKLLVLDESAWRPAFAIGVQDYLGTRLFQAKYLALSKRFGEFDVTAGYGDRRIDGVFGGIRYRPSALLGWSFVLEYDANDYGSDFRAELSGAYRRKGGATYAVDYRGEGWGAQLSYQDNETAANVYLAIPLMERELVPKIDEPSPYDIVTARASIVEWRADSRYAIALAQALDRQGYKDVHWRVRDDALEIAVTHERISLIGRAVGRVARTALRLGPRDMATLRITYTVNDQPLLTYEFRDPAVLERYLGGDAGRAALEAATSVTYASSQMARELRHEDVFALEATEQALYAMPSDRFLNLAGSRHHDVDLFPFNMRIFFNDPGQPVRYDAFSVVSYEGRWRRGTFLNGSVRFTWLENVSDIRQPSTSLLPHVRSDIGEYRREGDRLRLNTLLLNQYGLLRDRWYGRLSAGYYEEMYAGGGGQVLYLPHEANWAADVAVDALRQRAPGDALGFRDYSTVTAIASFRYRLSRYGVTATARIGRFLARDEGVRVELKRRFRSGVEIGGWYSRTNERDITNPGTPENPYHDKGIFVSIPLAPLLTKDTQERAGMALADYTRDVGQLVASPGDLYGLFERSLLFGYAEHDYLSELER